MYDVIIVGGGPAGLAAATYTLRYQLATLVIAPNTGGKALYRLDVPWLTGPEQILGQETVEQLYGQLIGTHREACWFDQVTQVIRPDEHFRVLTQSGQAFECRSIVVASGVRPRPMGIPGEDRLMGYGLSYSATSHAPLFAGRRVVVIGSDLRALRAAALLATMAEHVTLITTGRDLLGGYKLGRHLEANPNVTVLSEHAVVEIVGEKHVSGVAVAGPEGSGLVQADGVFIEYGLTANTAFLGSLVNRAPTGQILVDDHGTTSCAGLFAAGDVAGTTHAEQILIALGDGVTAGLSACNYVLETIPFS